jgi:hypothetical protein
MLRSLSLLALLVLSLGCPASAPDESRPAAPSSKAPRTIVLVTIDGLVAEELSAFGGARQTPALAELAASGSAWPGAWTTVPMTRPAVATYLTGLAPDRHRVTDDLFTALGPDVPTLATVLAASGYKGAALPDSDFLGPSSGLLRGFELTGDTPPVPVQPWRWLPYIRPPADLAQEFDGWIGTVPAGTSYFAWLHFSNPLLDRLADAVKPIASAHRAKARGALLAERKGIANVDAALGQIVGTLRARGDFDDALLIVAGTLGEVDGGASDPPGNGFSLAARAVRVPVVLHLPGGAKSPRAKDSFVWAPDVAATIAALAGVRLDPGAEGVSLTEAAPADRVVVSWTFALRDQLGLAPARVGRAGSTVIVDGPGTAEAQPQPDPAESVRIQGVLRSRPWPPAPGIPTDRARAILADLGLSPAEARTIRVLDPAKRREVGQTLLYARYLTKAGVGVRGIEGFREAFTLAPDLPAVRLDFGEALVLSSSGKKEGREVLKRGIELTPTDPEMLHWYAHAVWDDSWQEAEKVLRAILPYKPNEGDILYDLACTRSLAGDLDGSVEFLERAIEAGFRMWSLMETDPDLRALRESGRFAAVLKEYR